MHPTRSVLAFLLLTLLAMHGCSKPPTTPETSAQAPTPEADIPAASQPQQKAVQACDLITSQEMSTILGADVGAKPNDHSNGKTECIYMSDKADEGGSPYIEFAVEWGSGEGAMTGVGMLGQVEPGIASPYEGLGDQAVAVGPMLMIRTGEDLVTIVFSGVDDTPVKAKRIFDTAKARM